jgi:hypothetical protein
MEIPASGRRCLGWEMEDKGESRGPVDPAKISATNSGLVLPVVVNTILLIASANKDFYSINNRRSSIQSFAVLPRWILLSLLVVVLASCLWWLVVLVLFSAAPVC